MARASSTIVWSVGMAGNLRSLGRGARGEVDWRGDGAKSVAQAPQHQLHPGASLDTP